MATIEMNFAGVTSEWTDVPLDDISSTTVGQFRGNAMEQCAATGFFDLDWGLMIYDNIVCG